MKDQIQLEETEIAENCFSVSSVPSWCASTAKSTHELKSVHHAN
jgi:hypothetical protein